MFHGQTSVDVESGHEVWLTGLRVLQALCDEGRAAFGQQQELLYALGGAEVNKKTLDGVLFWKIIKFVSRVLK